MRLALRRASDADRVCTKMLNTRARTREHKGWQNTPRHRIHHHKKSNAFAALRHHFVKFSSCTQPIFRLSRVTSNILSHAIMTSCCNRRMLHRENQVLV